MLLKNDFIKPGIVYQDKLNKVGDGEVSQAFRKNQNLGDFKTKSKFLKILCRDNQFVDGDRVRIYINDLIIQESVMLEADFKEFEITLKKVTELSREENHLEKKEKIGQNQNFKVS